MESRNQRLLLAALLAAALPVHAQDVFEEPRDVVNPEVERRDIRPAEIDTEDFEVGAYVAVEAAGEDVVKQGFARAIADVADVRASFVAAGDWR